MELVPINIQDVIMNFRGSVLRVAAARRGAAGGEKERGRGGGEGALSLSAPLLPIRKLKLKVL